METNIKNNSAKDIMAQSIPVVPAIDVIVFPHMIVPLLVVDERIIQGVNQALSGQKLVLLLSAKSYDEEKSQEIETENLYKIGTVASIMRVINIPEGGIKILIQGMCRAAVENIQTIDGILTAKGGGLDAYCSGEKGGGMLPLIDRNLTCFTQNNVSDPWA